MRIGKRIASGATALALAGAGVIGLGAGSASANSSICTGYRTTYGAIVRFCVYASGTGAEMDWNIDTSLASTDERMYFNLTSSCYGTNDTVNDFQQRSGRLIVSCTPPFKGSSYSTESGRLTGSASTPWIY
ncbi:hypothetical protein [Streptomyces sp. CBMA152]|uniref:hypothetical protein n=1 Tax=Streptomyces sp. CBMA152 TaxID=1896312 RepID=UPI00166085AC|nr:hypothetical protein [Streptomyces sp. CBMA152]MBD0742609.1 hypothetical protein [Streptomyces sp. CBMA152]